tara:strand:- start:222 stop:476 length:255 start_codon:yes stop_codon:yes gene_type:complete
MQERTTDEIAQIFKNAGDSVTLINGGKPDWQTESEWKLTAQCNVEHLEIIKAYKKLDDTTSIWTTEDFTAIDEAIVTGKSIYEG